MGFAKEIGRRRTAASYQWDRTGLRRLVVRSGGETNYKRDAALDQGAVLPVTARAGAVKIHRMLRAASWPPGPEGAEVSRQPRPEALSFGLVFSGAGLF